MRKNGTYAHLVSILCVAALWGCSSSAPSEQASPTDDVDVVSTSTPPALDFGEEDDDVAPSIGLGTTPERVLGLKCGGVAHMACPRGQACRIDHDGSSDPMGTCVPDVGRDNRKLAALGERCGGVAGFECQDGLSCKLDDVDQSDPMGTCVRRPPPTK